MGPVILYEKVLEKFGHEVIMPLRPNKRTIELGAKYSPEFACFPFKVLMGTYIQTCERGVDIIVSSGGHGPCRAGFYGEIHKRILKQMGFDVHVVIFDSFFRNPKKFIKELRFIRNGKSLIKAIPTALFCYKLLQYIDTVEKRITKIRPYEKIFGQTDEAFDKINNLLRNTYNYKQLAENSEKCDEILNSIERHEVEEDDRIRIGIVGEIYVVMESSVNGEIEKKLNYLGCETVRSQYLLEWVDFNFFPVKSKKQHELDILKKGEEYIEINIGGHAKQTVGSIADFRDRGFDGIVHLMPFSCLPELVSQSVIQTLSKEIPVMTLSLDEQTGTANNQTRIEAFVDLLKNKKYKNKSFSKPLNRRLV